MTAVVEAPVLELTGHSERKGNIPALDVLRAGAAIYVAAYHSVDLLTASGRDFHHSGGAIEMIKHGNMLGLLGFGRYAVLVFFVLSGFVVHLRQARTPNVVNSTGSWLAQFGWRRTLRIYPPMIAAIALTAVIAFVGFRLFPDLYGHRLLHPTGAGLPSRIGSLKEAVLAAVPIKGGGSFGADGVLWSVGYEVLFYIAYVPLLLLFHRKLKVPAWGLLLGTTLIAVALELVHGKVPHSLSTLVLVAMYLPVWVLGLWLADLYAKGIAVPYRGVLVIWSVGIMFLAALRSDDAQNFRIDAVWAVGFAGIIAALALHSDTAAHSSPSKTVRTAAKSARWSYSLYLIHMPILIFALGLFGTGTAPLSNGLLVLSAFLLAIVGALALYWTVEKPFTKVAGHPPAAFTSIPKEI